MPEAAQRRLQGRQAPDRLAVASGVRREDLERLAQALAAGARVDVVEDVAEDQHAVALTPERDVAG